MITSDERIRVDAQKAYEDLKVKEAEILYNRALEQLESYPVELRAFIERTDKIWTLLTNEPHINFVATRTQKHDSDLKLDYEMIELTEYSKLEKAGDALREGYMRYGKSVNPVKVWHRWLGKITKKYAEFLPGELDTGDVLNTWLGYPYPEIEADYLAIEPMDMHLREVIANGNDEHYELLIKFFAHMLQRPMERNAVALVLRGMPGSGKGIVGNYFGHLVTPHFFPANTLDAVVGNFNNLMDKMLYVYVDNAVWSYDRKTSEKLKSLISENRIIINDKYMKIVNPRNSIHFCFSSNDLEGASLPIEVGDRRFLILDVNPKYVGRIEDYFMPLLGRSNTYRARCAWMYKLMHKKISDSDFAVLPSTTGRVQQMLLQRESIVQWVVEWLRIGELEIDVEGFYNSEEPWPTGIIEVPRNLLFNRYVEYWEQNKAKFIRLGETGPLKAKFGQFMHELNPAIPHKNSQYGKQQMYLGKNTYMFPVLPLEEYKKNVARYLKADVSDVFGRG